MNFPVYITKSALSGIQHHFKEAAERHREAMGLLLGCACIDENGLPFTMVDAYATAQNDASATHVRFAPAAFSELSKLLASRQRDELVVGWAHSHPSYGCFLSPTDLKTQQDYFGESFHTALVIDPLADSGAAGKSGKTRFYQLTPDKKSYKETPFAVIVPQ